MSRPLSKKRLCIQKPSPSSVYSSPSRFHHIVANAKMQHRERGTRDHFNEHSSSHVYTFLHTNTPLQRRRPQSTWELGPGKIHRSRERLVTRLHSVRRNLRNVMRTREFDETIIQTPSENSRGLATGKTPFSVASGLIVRPSLSLDTPRCGVQRYLHFFLEIHSYLFRRRSFNVDTPRSICQRTFSKKRQMTLAEFSLRKASIEPTTPCRKFGGASRNLRPAVVPNVGLTKLLNTNFGPV